MNRREFMKLGSLFAAGGFLATVGQIEINDETNTPVVERVEIPIKNLKPALEGFTIVQLSDIHLQPFTRPELVRRAVEMSNELRPDLTVLTGDYVWRDQEAAFELAPILAGLNARHGVYSVLGNHDHWLDVEATKRAFAEVGLPMLINQGVEIHQGNGSFYLAGMDDGWSGQPDLNQAVEKTPSGVPIRSAPARAGPCGRNLPGPAHRPAAFWTYPRGTGPACRQAAHFYTRSGQEI